MRFKSIVLVGSIFAFGIVASQAMFIRAQTSLVPINRLFANLELRLARNPNDFETTYDLARLHAMAYSTNVSQVEVLTNSQVPFFGYSGNDSGVPRTVVKFADQKARLAASQHLTNAIALYQRAIVLLKKSPKPKEHRWLILPNELGLAWCLDQAGRREEALTAYRRTLRIAWKQEITGDFNVSDWIKGAWQDVKAGQNPLHAQTRGFIGPGVCYSQEVIGYTLKLLDPKKDAKEIAELQEDQKTISSMGRAITPILVPLEADTHFSDLINPNARVLFDLDGSGIARPWGWVTPKAAWLVFNADGSGKITSGLQMFGNFTFWIFWRDGYDALSSLDTNGDGILRGEELSGLALWQDRNGNGICDPGEVQPLSAFGITALACQPTGSTPNGLWNDHGVTYSDGTTRATYDWIAESEALAVP